MGRNSGDPYENLANAIIIQAANDYRAALKKIKKNPRNKDAIADALSIERFFHSRWYGALTAVDGDFIIKKIRVEAGQPESIGGNKNFGGGL